MSKQDRKEFLNRILVVDIEATTWDNRDIDGKSKESEIIEIGCSELFLDSGTIEKKHDLFVRPVMNPILSPFCTELTSITQEVLDTQGVPFIDALNVLSTEFNSRNMIWASWGDYDRIMFRRQCLRYGYQYPFGEQHINVKTLFSLMYRLDHMVGMKYALSRVGIPLEGTHHRGIDDSYNIAKILRLLLE